MKKNSSSYILFEMIRNYLTDFLPHVRNLSAHTIQATRDSLNLLLDYCNAVRGVPLLEIGFETLGNVALIIDFLAWLRNERNCSSATLNQRISCIRGFFKYAAYEDAIYVSLYQSLLTIPQRKITKNTTLEFMSEEALKAILSIPDLCTRIGLRNAFYMTLMYDSAARNGEIISLRVKDIVNEKSSPYMFVYGKGRRRRSVPLMLKTMEIYSLYLKCYHQDCEPNDFLFYTKHNGEKFPMSVDNVAKFISKYANEASRICPEMPKRVHPHMFRRSRAMHLYRNGMPLALLSEFLGHENPETTLIYASADTEMKRKAIERASSHLTIHEGITPTPIWQNDDDMIRKLYGLK